MNKVLLLGIGQSMRGDDAAGLEAVREWQKKFPETAQLPNIQIETNELPGLALLEFLRDTDAALLVDAVQSGATPGTIHHLDETNLASFLADSKSAHGWGIAETLRMGRQLDEVNANIRILGIEAEHYSIGSGLSKPINDAMPVICVAIESEINNMLN